MLLSKNNPRQATSLIKMKIEMHEEKNKKFILMSDVAPAISKPADKQTMAASNHKNVVKIFRLTCVYTSTEVDYRISVWISLTWIIATRRNKLNTR